MPTARPEDLGSFITQVGFPVALCIFLIWRVDKRLEDLSKSMVRVLEVLRIKHSEDE